MKNLKDRETAKMSNLNNRIAVRQIRADYDSAMEEARNCIEWLRRDLGEAERGLDLPFTPGNMGSVVSRLEAARWKAKALREALIALESEAEE